MNSARCDNMEKTLMDNRGATRILKKFVLSIIMGIQRDRRTICEEGRTTTKEQSKIRRLGRILSTTKTSSIK